MGEAAKVKLLEEAAEKGKTAETKSSKFEKLKSKTINAVKPQVDKFTEQEKEKQAEHIKEREAAKQEGKAEEPDATKNVGGDDESVESVTPETTEKSADTAAAAAAKGNTD